MKLSKKLFGRARVIENYMEVPEEKDASLEDGEEDWVYLVKPDCSESEDERSVDENIAAIRVISKDVEKAERADLNKQAGKRSHELWETYHRLLSPEEEKKRMSFKDWEKMRKRDSTFIAGKLEEVKRREKARDAPTHRCSRSVKSS